MWAFIILTVDRALLATYRAYQSFVRKAAQFGLRMVVAALMGITISHPLTLLLFKDTISSVIEQHREARSKPRVRPPSSRKSPSRRASEPLETVRSRSSARPGTPPSTPSSSMRTASRSRSRSPTTRRRLKAERDAKIAEAVAPRKRSLEALDTEMAKMSADYQKIAEELNHWQTEFEREVNGQRSGIIGLGPRAKSIQEDQLTWRRAESTRLSGVLDTMTKNRVVLVAEIKAAEDGVNAALDAKAAEEAARLKAEKDRIEILKQQVQQQQADQFVGQQNAIRETLKDADRRAAAPAQKPPRGGHQLVKDEETRIATIRAEPRRDILTQTSPCMTLREGQQGGTFALVAYLVLTMLFMLVDTIPLIVKFFSKPGPYDTLLDREEVKFDRERQAFLTSFNRYMKELTESKLLHLTQHKPLERALIEGVDRSRAAKEFLEHLMELERSFDEKIRVAREAWPPSGMAAKAEMLEEMAGHFYADLRERMETFFRDDRRTPVTARG